MITRLTTPYTDEEIFGALSNPVKQWWLERFSSFSAPQQYSILTAKKRENVLISSPTGSGKTLSAFTAILDDLVQSAQAEKLPEGIFCVYISPLKALGNDIHNNLIVPLEQLQTYDEKIGNITVATRTGDTTQAERAKLRKNPPHILITTPESLSLLLTSPKFAEHLRSIEYVIIDEVHALADNKRGSQLSLALERLENISTFTRIGLSATIQPLEDIAQYLVGTDRDCKIVDVSEHQSLDIQVLSPTPNLVSATHGELMNKQYELIHELVQQHTTTLIFTNTRAATERVVHQLKKRHPSDYQEHIAKIDDNSDEVGEVRTSIAAHHGSLSKEHRLFVEEQLRQGTLKCVVSSTSLELGIDIGSVDLVILLGSPKSVARALQRIGRSGHRLHATAKGRIIVLDRDDLVECCALARAAVRREIDHVHIPRGPLDVLAQEIYGMLIQERTPIRELFARIQQAYPYRDLTYNQYMSVIKYLSGEYSALEDRHVYAKIWYDEETGMMGRKGRLARVIYSTNIGTIPDQTNVIVKIGEVPIGSISEPFLESLKKGDVFVLGGETYQFKFSRGMTAQVQVAIGRKPTVPSWYSEMLPLSYELARKVRNLRGHVAQLFEREQSQEEITTWLKEYMPIDDAAATSIHNYMRQQYLFSAIPQAHEILIEHIHVGNHKYAIVHTLYGRRTNDALSRAVAYVMGKLGNTDVEIGITDNGFFVRHQKAAHIARALKLLQTRTLGQLMNEALKKTEILRRRFRHCAGRSLMILRTYKGQRKSVGKQQVSSQALMTAVRRIGDEFPILQEAQREVLEDVMDVQGVRNIIEGLEEGTITIQEKYTDMPSPFAFSLIMQGYADVLRIEEKQNFLRRMHQEVLAKIATKERKEELLALVHPDDFSYDEEWEKQEITQEAQEINTELLRKEELYRAARKLKLPAEYVYSMQRIVEGHHSGHSDEFVNWLKEELSGTVNKVFSDELVSIFRESLGELNWKG